MHVEVHDQLRTTTRVQATRVVVYDLHGNPISAVIEITPGQYVAVTAANKKFNEILKAMGILQTIVVDHLDVKKLPALE